MAHSEAHNEAPESPERPRSEPAVPLAVPQPTVPAHDAARPGGDPPAAGWGAPQYPHPQQDPPAAGWGAPQQPQNQYAGWGASPQQGPQDPHAPYQQQGPGNAGWGAPEQLYAQPAPGWNAGGRGGSPSAASRWRGLSTTQKGLTAAAAAVVIAGGAGAAVWAATSTTSSPDAAANGFGGAAGQGGPGGGRAQGGTGTQGQNGQGFQGGMRGSGAGGLGVGMLGQVLHGEFVVVQDNTNVTMVEQSGTVTAVSGQSVTVKSSDGYQQTYAISSSTQIGARSMRGQGSSGGSSSSTTLAQGQTVSVTALKDGLAAQTVAILGTGSTGSGTSS